MITLAFMNGSVHRSELYPEQPALPIFCRRRNRLIARGISRGGLDGRIGGAVATLCNHLQSYAMGVTPVRRERVRSTLTVRSEHDSSVDAGDGRSDGLRHGLGRAG